MNVLTFSSHPSLSETWLLGENHGGGLVRYAIQPPPVSLDEASLKLPSGAYTTFRTYHRDEAFHLEDHFTRLEKSAHLAGRPIQLERDRIRAAIRKAIQEFHTAEARIRLNLDLSRKIGDIYISLEGLKTPTEEQYERGVKVATVHLTRENPSAKLTDFIAQAAVIRRSMPEDAVEGIMVDPEGNYLEGLSSNFFGVIGGEIYTSNQAVLAGITRALVIEEATKAGDIVHLDRLPSSYSQRFSEAFITSSSRAVLPVAQIDGMTVGDGTPGPITKDLLSRYLARIEREIKPI